MTYIVPIKTQKEVTYNNSVYTVSYFNNLISTTAVDSVSTEWDSTISFAKDSYVKVSGLNRIYRLASTTSRNQYPPANPSVWIDYGATNTFKLFDDIIGSQTEFVNTMTVVIDANRLNSLAFLNMENITSIRVLQEDIGLSITLYDETFTLTDYGVLSLYDYWYLPTKIKRDLVVQGLQFSVDAKVTLEFIGSSDAKIGAVVSGMDDNIAVTLYGTRIDLKDYSKYVTDDYGNTFFSRRGYARIITAQALIDTNTIDDTADKLIGLRGGLTVFVGDEREGGYSSLTTLGYIESVGFQIDNPSKIKFPIKIIGVT